MEASSDNIREDLPMAVTVRNGHAASGDDEQQWYALRCTYGRSQKAYEYFLGKGIRSFYPTITRSRTVDGAEVLVEESRIPNIFFAYGTIEALRELVYDNVHDETRYVRFYYNQHHDGTKEPLVVPDRQIQSLMRICKAKDANAIMEPYVVEKFQKGQHVMVREGIFAGVEGVVARFRGQQRVGIVIQGLMTVLTAYVPSAFLERISPTEP